jgi:hypothetical protein
MKLTVRCKLISDIKTKINANNKTVHQYNNIAQRYLGLFVEQKLSSNITHVNGWSAMTAPEGEGAANFFSSESKLMNSFMSSSYLEKRQ